MEPIKKDTERDFSIVFNEIEKFHIDNPSFNENGINEEDIKNDEIIREFSDICREINNTETNPAVYLTFS
jgi:hypothetical protein